MSISTSEEERAGIGVVTRAAAILRALGGVSTGMSLGQIAKQVGLARSTVQRVVAALEAEGFITTGLGAGRITLGPEFMRLAKLARPVIIERMHPIMEDISYILEETVDLSIIQRNRIVFLDQIIGSQRLLAVSRIGDAFPLHCSSVGKAYLATLSVDEIRRTLGTSYERRTPHTTCDLPALVEALESVRLSGIGIDEQEHSEGICAAGIAFDDDAGDWYGLSIPIPVTRFRAKRSQAEALLKKAKEQIGFVIAGKAESTKLCG